MFEMNSAVQILIFCGISVFPILFSSTFVLKQYDDFQRTRSLSNALQFVFGVILVTSLLLYLSGIITFYLNLLEIGTTVLFIAAFASLLSILGLGGIEVKTKLL